MSQWLRGLTGRQWLILLIAWMGWVFDIMDTALFNFAKGPMLTEMLGGADAYKSSGAAIEGRIQMVFLVGWAIGGLCFGILADRWGRSRTLIVTILIYSALTGLTALAQTPEQVMVLRLLTALGIGGEWAAGAALVAETFPDRLRAPAAAVLQSAAAFGPWFAAGINLGVPTGAWRTLFVVGIAPAIVCVLVRFSMKDVEPPIVRARATPLEELFAAQPWRRHAIIATVLGVVGVTGAGILPFWLPNLIKQAGAGLTPEAIKNFTSTNTFTLHIGTLLGVFAFPWIAERIGRRRAFAVFFVGAPLCTAIALFGGAALDRLLWLLPLASFFAIGLSAGFVLYFPELFPTRLRATGSGLAYNAGRIFSAPMPALIGLLITSAGNDPAYGVLVASSIYVLGLIALPFAPETKGKPLPAE